MSALVLKIAATSYCLLSVLLFSLYGLDKAQAVASGRRIPERTLHILSILGGFTGGLLGRVVFHHKTRKSVFLIILLASAVIHSMLWAILFSFGW